MNLLLDYQILEDQESALTWVTDDKCCKRRGYYVWSSQEIVFFFFFFFFGLQKYSVTQKLATCSPAVFEAMIETWLLRFLSTKQYTWDRDSAELWLLHISVSFFH